MQDKSKKTNNLKFKKDRKNDTPRRAKNIEPQDLSLIHI